MGTFALDINKFVKKCGDNPDLVVRKTVKDIGKSLDEKSPVGNPDRWQNPDAKPEGYAGGHFHANWQLGVDSMPMGEIKGIDPEGSTATLDKNIALIPPKAAGHVYYYANNVPYAQALEDGHSTIAPGPNAIVGRTAVEFQSMINKALAELK